MSVCPYYEEDGGCECELLSLHGHEPEYYHQYECPVEERRCRLP